MSVGKVLAFKKTPSGILAQSTTDTIKLIAGESLGYPRAVMIDNAGKAVLFNPSTASPENFVGITSHSVNTGEVVTIKVSGEFEYPGWGLSSGALFAGASGVITNMAPASGLLMVIGFALTSTRVLINPKGSIQL